MCARSAFPQHAMGVLRNIFDLHTGHGAILAPLAPLCKYLRRLTASDIPARRSDQIAGYLVS
jgi:hypothetical protein